MDMWGIVPIRNDHFHLPVKDVGKLAVDDELCRAMVTCHSLTIIDGKLSGDPLDLKVHVSVLLACAQEWLSLMNCCIYASESKHVQ